MELRMESSRAIHRASERAKPGVSADVTVLHVALPWHNWAAGPYPHGPCATGRWPGGPGQAGCGQGVG